MDNNLVPCLLIHGVKYDGIRRPIRISQKFRTRRMRMPEI